MKNTQAHTFNIDAAQSELNQRSAEGENVSHLRVDPETAAIVHVFPEPKADSAFTITPFDIDRAAEHGNTRAQLSVRGYWSGETATAYLERRVEWVKDPGTGAVRTPYWTISITHSSGGRDTEQVESDLVAEANFGAGLVALAQYAANFVGDTVHIREVARRHDAIEEAQRLAHEAEVAARLAKIEADRPLGDRSAKALLDLAVATTKHLQTTTVITLFDRGSPDPKMATVQLSRGGIIQFHRMGTGMSRATFLEWLGKSSHRTVIGDHLQLTSTTA